MKPYGTNLTYIACMVDLPALIPNPGETREETGYAMQNPVLSSNGPEGYVIDYTYFWNNGDSEGPGWSQDPNNNQVSLLLPIFMQQLDLSDPSTKVTVNVSSGAAPSGTKTGVGTVSTVKAKGDFEIPGMPPPANQPPAVKVFQETYEDGAAPLAWQLRPFVIQSITQQDVYYIVVLSLTDALHSYDDTFSYVLLFEYSTDSPPQSILMMPQPSMKNLIGQLTATTLMGIGTDFGPTGITQGSSPARQYPWNSVTWDTYAPVLYAPNQPGVILSPYNPDPTFNAIRSYPNIVTL